MRESMFCCDEQTDVRSVNVPVSSWNELMTLREQIKFHVNVTDKLM